MSRKEHILDTINDLCSDFLYYDRKEDEELGKGEIEEAVENEEITVEEIISKFEEVLYEHFDVERIDYKSKYQQAVSYINDIVVEYNDRPLPPTHPSEFASKAMIMNHQAEKALAFLDEYPQDELDRRANVRMKLGRGEGLTKEDLPSN